MTDKQDRQIEILNILKQQRHSTVAALMRDLHVSRPTVLRDLEDLSRAGYPIYSVPGKNGGVFVVEGAEIFIPAMKSVHEQFLRSLYPRLQTEDEIEKMDEILRMYSNKKYL